MVLVFEAVTRFRLLALLVASTTCAGCGAEPPRPRNLLVLCVDTLRADQLGAYGAAPSLTPNLDRLAGESVVFERAHAAASWTLPSVAAVFTGLCPSSTRLWTFETRLADSYSTLAERLESAGFTTHGVASHVFFDANYGLQQGFDSFDDELCHRKGEAGWREVTSPEVAGRAVRWLEERGRSNAREPWMLFAHFFDPHLPYVDHHSGVAPAPEEFARYRSEIAFTDVHVGALLDALEKSGLAGDTAVLFFSDHGESFLEHPPIQRHSYSLFEEELHVPLFLRVPGLAPRRVTTAVRLVDLRPTLLALLGVGEGPGAVGEGVDLGPLLTGRAEGARPPNLAEIRLKDGYHRNAIVDGDWKLIEDVSNRRLELYDLAADPRERENLVTREPERAAELASELRIAIERAELLGHDFAPDAAVEHTPAELEHLRAMGYAGDDEPGDSRKE